MSTCPYYHRLDHGGAPCRFENECNVPKTDSAAKSGSNLPWTFYGRPIKPLSLALMIANLTIGMSVLLEKNLQGEVIIASIVAIVALACSVFLFIGWVTSRQKYARVSLLLSAFVWVFAACMSLFVEDYVNSMASVAWAVAAGGSYLLEVYNPPCVHLGRQLDVELGEPAK